MRTVGFLFYCSVLLFAVLSAICYAQTATPAKNLEAVIKNARRNGDHKGEQRVTNLKYGLQILRPSDIQGIRCGIGQDAKSVNIDQADELAGKLLSKALEKYLPTLAAAIESAPAAGVAAFLTPERIGPDAVGILNQNDESSKTDVQNAARQMLQDTRPDDFKKVPKTLMAKIVACSI